VNTEEDNDDMYSTDDESGEYFNKEKQYYAERNSGGPYNINPSKPYKPACIVFIDIYVTLTFFMVSLMYFWVQIENTDVVDFKKKEFAKYVTFMPTNVSILWFVLLGKNICNISFLKHNYGMQKANSSKVTGSLFWFRIAYDFIVIGGSLVIFSILKKKAIENNKEHDKDPHTHSHHVTAVLKMGENFVIWIIFAPIAFMEICVFWFCKVEAENRQIYQ
jgi:hypothetical protein